jgi:hypothetical protein
VNKYVAGNAAMNAVLAASFVCLNEAALRAQMEETFVVLALTYGLVVTLSNAVYVAWCCRQAR